MVESKLEDGQCCFHPGHSTQTKFSLLRQIFVKSLLHANDVFACVVDLDNACKKLAFFHMHCVL